jgi:hypothetical protein
VSGQRALYVEAVSDRHDGIVSQIVPSGPLAGEA